MASKKIIKVVTPAPGFRRDRVAGVQRIFTSLFDIRYSD